ADPAREGAAVARGPADGDRDRRSPGADRRVPAGARQHDRRGTGDAREGPADRLPARHGATLTLPHTRQYDPRSPVSDDLAARLATVGARSTLRITTRGPRTGRPHTVTIWLVAESATVSPGTLNARRDWVRNLTKTPTADLDLGRLRVRGHARVVTDAIEQARVGALLVKKYWIAWIGWWFGAHADRTFRVDDLALVEGS